MERTQQLEQVRQFNLTDADCIAIAVSLRLYYEKLVCDSTQDGVDLDLEHVARLHKIFTS